MARAGRGGAALATAAIGSFVAGTLGTAALAVRADGGGGRASLRARRYFALAVLAFVAVSAMVGESRLNGFASLLFGLLLGVIGIDPLTGANSHGSPSASRNCSTASTSWSLPLGTYSSPWERCCPPGTPSRSQSVMLRESLWMTREEWARSWKAWLQRRRDWLPARRAPRGGRRDSHVPLLRG